MRSALNPPLLRPRLQRASTVFDDENLDFLSHLLDDCFHIPGTSIRFGLDGIVGFLPGIGDAVAGIASCIILFAAWVRGVSYVTLARMLANWGIEVLIGAVPIAGNLFDIAWKANRRNYALLTSSLADPQGTRRRSWLFLAVLCGIFATMLALPILLFGWLSIHLLQALGNLWLR